MPASVQTDPELDLREIPDELAAPAPELDGIPDALLDEPPAESIDGQRFAESPFATEYRKRVRQERDLTVLISDWNNERGTGKTTLTCKLAEWCDRTDAGFVPAKAHLSPQRLIGAYTGQPLGSGLALDEAEVGANAREAMTIVNRLLSKIVSMARIEEKYVFFNMPASSHIDKNLLDLADFWILVQKRGRARVYRLKGNPFEGKTYPSPTQILTWNADLGPAHVKRTFRALTEEKKEHLDGEGEQSTTFVTEAEAREAREKAVDQARAEVRDQIIARLLAHPDTAAALNQTQIGNIALNMSQSHVSNVKSDVRNYDLAGIPTGGLD
jgi:hypothetical protein